MIDITNEQARTYTWILQDKNTPSLKIIQPLFVTDTTDGGHIVTGSDNCAYVVKGWQILKVELKGGVSPEKEATIISD